MTFSEQALLHAYPFRSTTPLLVDVGAHQGFFSLSFAQRGWRVLAFEPETKNRAALMRERGYSTFVSESAPITAYARAGEAGEPLIKGR